MLTWIVESHGEKKQKKIKNEFLKSWNGKLYLHKVLPSSFPQCPFSFFRAGFFPVGRWIRVNMETLTKDGGTAATGSFKALVS